MNARHMRQAAAGLDIFVFGIAGQGVVGAAEITHGAGGNFNGTSVPAIEESMDGTSHDFSANLSEEMGDDYCRVCHVFEDGPDGPVVRLTGDGSADTLYTTYSGYDLRHSPSQPFGVSKFCLSCHDGTVAMDIHGVGLGAIDPVSGLGTNLSDDHPVSVRYDYSDYGIRSASTPLYFGDGSAGTIADLLEDGAVQCSSCHDVHNVQAAGNRHLLSIGNTGSALCMTCHAM